MEQEIPTKVFGLGKISRPVAGRRGCSPTRLFCQLPDADRDGQLLPITLAIIPFGRLRDSCNEK